jgi:hypothetical protein
MAAKWLDTLATVAPVAAAMIGGPAGLLAGSAIKAVASVFGLGDNTTKAELEKAVLGMKAEHLVALKEVDARLEQARIEAEVKREDIAYQDRASARELAGKTGSNMPAVLLAVTASLFAGSLSAIFMGYMTGLPHEDKALINYAIGQISGWVNAGVTFYYGSTVSSARKDSLLYNSEPVWR